MTRAEGERTRLRHSIERMRAHLVSIEIGLRLQGSLGTEVAQTVMQTASELGMQIAKHDAFVLAAYDAEESDR